MDTESSNVKGGKVSPPAEPAIEVSFRPSANYPSPIIIEFKKWGRQLERDYGLPRETAELVYALGEVYFLAVSAGRLSSLSSQVRKQESLDQARGMIRDSTISNSNGPYGLERIVQKYINTKLEDISLTINIVNLLIVSGARHATDTLLNTFGDEGAGLSFSNDFETFFRDETRVIDLYLEIIRESMQNSSHTSMNTFNAAAPAPAPALALDFSMANAPSAPVYWGEVNFPDSDFGSSSSHVAGVFSGTSSGFGWS